MRYVNTGSRRMVLLIGPYAVKLPRVTDGWERFLRGLLANMQEASAGRLGWPELCPVVCALPGGFAVVMRRAEVCTEETLPSVDELRTRLAAANAQDRGITVEMKPDSWGWLDGRIVAVDYG